MKEKIKKIFLNKKLWCSILETICAVLIFTIGYFSGFVSGLAVDDSIRTELIDKSLNNSKYDNKRAISNQVYSIPYSVNFMGFYNGNNNYFSTFYLNASYDVNYSFNDYEITIHSVTYKFRFDEIVTNGMSYVETISTDVSNSLISNNLNITFNYTQRFKFSNTFLGIPNSSYELCTFFYDTNLPSINTSHLITFNNGYNAFMNASLELQTYIADVYPNRYNEYSSLEYFYTPYSDIIPFNNDLAIKLFNEGFSLGEDLGASDEELQQAYQNGYQKGLETGVQAGIDGANNADSVFDRVFMIIRNAGASFLNLFDFYIFPNMPFYVVIAIPFILGSLFILFKILIK